MRGLGEIEFERKLKDLNRAQRAAWRRQRRRFLAALIAAFLGLGIFASPAQAGPACAVGWCGRVTVDEDSRAKCTVAIKYGNEVRYLANRAGYHQASWHHFKDTNAFYVKKGCSWAKWRKGDKYVKSYQIGRWYSVSDFQAVNLVVR